jgi:hypothetical protein
LAAEGAFSATLLGDFVLNVIKAVVFAATQNQGRAQRYYRFWYSHNIILI